MSVDEKPHRVFISYTAEDLAAHADVVTEVVRKLQWVAVDHRDWGSTGTPSVDACRETVCSCDILVVLVAHRYGWVPPAEQGGDGETSITWWEVRWAREHGLPVLSYLVEDDAPWPADKIEGLKDPAALERLGKLKLELRQGVVGFFSSPESLLANLGIDLPRAARKIAERPEEPKAKVPQPAGLEPPAVRRRTAPEATRPVTPAYSYRPLHIRFGKGGGGCYPVEVTASPAGSVATRPCDLDPTELRGLLWSSAARAEGAVRLAQGEAGASLLPATEDIKRVGGILHQSLFTSHLRECLQDSLRSIDPQRREGIRFLIDATRSRDLAELPWELLYDAAQDDFLFTDEMRPVVRWIDVDQPEPSLAVEPPLRVLVAVAHPKDRPELRVGEELAHLDEELRDLAGEGLIEALHLDHATTDRLDAALLEHEPHVLHFVGHGDFVGNEGVVVFEQPGGRSLPIRGPKLANYLRNHRGYLRLVFLNSCLGAAAAPGDPFGGVAQSLIRRGIPAVIAMQFPIPDRVAVTLARQFYRYLANGRPVDAALTSARAFLALSCDVEWGAPALYMRTPDGRLFDFGAAGLPGAGGPAAPSGEGPGSKDGEPGAQGAREEEAEPSPGTWRRPALGLLGLALLAALGLGGLLWLMNRPEHGAAADSMGPPPRDEFAEELYLGALDEPGSPELPRALGELERALALDPDRAVIERLPAGARSEIVTALLGGARRSRSAGDLERAAELLESLLSIAPENREARRLLEEIRSELAGPEAVTPDDGGTHEVRHGDTLWDIAGSRYGNPALWPRIYNANRDRIRDPDLIFPDQELVVPRPATEAGGITHHRVEEGDHLWRIAGATYGDPALWPLIYDANRDRIRDPDLIYPDQRLEIPRGLSADDQRQRLRRLWAELR